MLRRRPLAENDQILSMLSAGLGRFDCVAKGARKSSSRLVALAEPFTLLSAQFARGRTLCYLTEARPLRAHGRLREDYDRLIYGSYVLELFLHSVPPEMPAPGPFRLLVGSLAELENGADPFWLTRWVELRLLQLLGYAPELEQCCACGSPEVASFSADAGGVLCRECGRESQPLGPPAQAALRFLSSCRLKGALGLTLEGRARRQLERALQSQWAAHCPQHLRSARLLSS